MKSLVPALLSFTENEQPQPERAASQTSVLSNAPAPARQAHPQGNTPPPDIAEQYQLRYISP